MSFTVNEHGAPSDVAIKVHQREDLGAINKEPLLAMLDHLVDNNVDYVKLNASGHLDKGATSLTVHLTWNTGSPE